MSGVISSTVNGDGVSVSANKNNAFAMSMLTMLFFMWGFITCMNDILIPHFKAVFSLNYTQAMLIQFCFFGAYFLMSLPAGGLVKAIGYQQGIVVGLLIASVGCFLFIPAAGFQAYTLFLVALFVLASGVTVLQVAANPYVTELGDPGRASSRLNFTQAFNSLGTTLAPLLGSVVILSVAAKAGGSSANEVGLEAVKLPYIILGGMLLVLALLFTVIKLPRINLREGASDPVRPVAGMLSLLSERHLLLGALAMFIYVGAEVSVGSVLVNYISDELGMGFSESQAAKYVSFYWGGAMVGRFVGAVLMRYIDPARLLMVNGVASVSLLLVTMLTDGSTAMWSVLLIGLCNSIMFPTIFSLSLEGLTGRKSEGAGILCLAIVGGAVLPMVHGGLADVIGLKLAFLLPCACYVYIVYFGLTSKRANRS